MEDKSTKTTLTLYCGLAGAGKSTHARERVIPTDEFLDMVDAFEEPDAEDETRWDTIYHVENKHNKFSGCELVSKKQKKIRF